MTQQPLMPSPGDAAETAEMPGWRKAAAFAGEVIWGSLPPLFVIPVGVVILVAAKLRERDYDRAGVPPG